MQTRKVVIRKTNRRIKESPYQIACKEFGGALGNIEMTHHTDVDEVVSNIRIDPGSNVKVWYDISDELNKSGVFDKLAKFIRGQK